MNGGARDLDGDATAAAATKDGVSPSSSPSSKPSNKLTVRVVQDRSLQARLIQSLIKPLRPRLVGTPKTPWPRGSNRLLPHHSVKGNKCHVEETNIVGMWMLEIVPNSSSSSSMSSMVQRLPDDVQQAPAMHHHHHQHRVYYFAGGGFQNVPTSEHWKMLSEVASRLGQEEQKDKTDEEEEEGEGKGDRERERERRRCHIRLFIVSYPLAPHSPAADSLRMLRGWLELVLADATDKGYTVALAGDSSGGNIATTLAVGVTGGWDASRTPIRIHGDHRDYHDHALADDPLGLGRSPHARALTAVLLLSPALDMRNSNQDMAAVAPHDPILTPAFTGTVAETWCGVPSTSNDPAKTAHHQRLRERGPPPPPPQLEASDPRVSPVLADLSGLADAGVRVDGLIGGCDVLAPDANLFVDRLRRAGVQGQWEIWQRQMHVWVLAWWALPEGKTALDWIVQRLREGVP